MAISTMEPSSLILREHVQINGRMLQDDPSPCPKSQVKIVSYPVDAGELLRNPIPQGQGEQDFGEFLSAQTLKAVAGARELTSVTCLDMKLDTGNTSVANLGALVPYLKILNLNNSYVASIRDLGTGLHNLEALWMSRCCLSELDGISCFGELKELYLSFNEVVDLSPVSLLDNLQVLDLEGNNVDDIAQVEFLSLCPSLTNLTLDGNPVTKAPKPDSRESELKFYSYREAVLNAVPQLEVLDGQPFLVELINGQKSKRSHPASLKDESKGDAFRDEMKLIHESLKALEELEEVESHGDYKRGSRSAPLSPTNVSLTRPSSARRRPHSSNNPLSQLRPSSGCKSASPTPVTLFDDSSVLTQGSVICGNPVRALRRRAKDMKNLQHFENNLDRPLTPKKSFIAEHTWDTASEAENFSNVLSELKQWRSEYESILKEDRSFASVEDCRSNYCSLASSIRGSLSPVPPDKPKMQVSLLENRRGRDHAVASATKSECGRPHTVSDFRTRRYRLHSPETDRRLLADDVESKPESQLTAQQENDDLGIKCPAVSQPCTTRLRDDQASAVSRIIRSRRPGTARAALHGSRRSSGRISEDSASMK